ncbi:hydroxyacylglutathione hydrolase [Glaciecola sp. MH2013]|uniref:hydroxyacylglutathione hydrolase n=1 Tax=Glaciecola sp. MH2013 TaxID=2785524 RepID=UPI00189EB771|nr:hydroxyacylglutathione hydrolase [Glaciecola sp. MH2013]MBF7073099.1 hydroxyacylglutathione hydrolase [Glaciecola sp. MH2013]
MHNIEAIPAFSDNYIWCMHDGENAIVVDPGDAAPVNAMLKNKGLQLKAVLITHHHHDHTGGIAELSASWPTLQVFGPDNNRIRGITHKLVEGDSLNIKYPSVKLKVMEIPGHTMDHIGYFNDELIFCGDTLFSAGCGRMFEGTPELFHASLQKIANLAGDTKVYCTHEYTQANVDFALHITPHNKALKEYAKWVAGTRSSGQITLPSTIKVQKDINPFLRCDDEQTRKSIESIMNLSATKPVEVFAALRACKDNF